jgi:hypothetical protein
MDPDPDADPSVFIIDLNDANKKLVFKKKFPCILLFEGTFTSFIKIKSHNSKNEGLSYYKVPICLMIEGSISRRPKNMWIRIRIRNTARNAEKYS